MTASRRDFLKGAGLAVLGLGASLPLFREAFAETGAGEGGLSGAGQWAMVVDLEKCRSEEVRRACAEACHRAHNVPSIPDPEEEVKWIWTERFENAFPDQVHPYLAPAVRNEPVLVFCNHCTHPACVRVCPTKATWKRKEDGIVMMDMHRCIGCRYCMAACPYGARSFNWRDPRDYLPRDAAGRFPSSFPTRTKGVVEKCDFCVERLREGKPPVCVEAADGAPGGRGALVFGDLGDPESDVRRILRERRTICRRVSMGTGPNVFYVI